MSAEQLHFLGLLGCAAMFIASTANAGADYQSVVGSKHDLSADPSVTGSADACGFCHEVENGSGKVLAGLNRNAPLATFEVYESATLTSGIMELGSASLHCLSCHDGVTPFDALGNSSGTQDNNMSVLLPQSRAIVGTDLNGHHPVGVRLPEHGAFAEISSVTNAGLSLYDGKVECPTCHEVHGLTGIDGFLRLENPGGALCQACHIK